jgi:DNA-binding XRE family transcriptional regulator
MDSRVKKLVEHQVKNEISEDTMCSEIGIVRKTYYNLKKEVTRPHESTMELVDKYLKNKDVV